MKTFSGSGAGTASDFGCGLDVPTYERLRDFFRGELKNLEPTPPPPLPEPYASLTGRPLPRRPLALILDIYGTLLASGAGEVGSASDAPRSGLGELGIALRRHGLDMSAQDFEAALRREVARDHERSRAEGLPYPEVDAADIVARVSGKPLEEARLLGAAREAIVNPSFPMPGARELLASARKAGLALGIVSNAQYYTPPLLEAAFGKSLAALGFSPELCVWSWRLGRAKPDPELFRALTRALAARGIPPERAVYIGNDLLNDIVAARGEGYGTALFAGDARSLRLRPGDARTTGVLPDTVLPSLFSASVVLRLGGRDPFGCLPRGAPGR